MHIGLSWASGEEAPDHSPRMNFIRKLKYYDSNIKIKIE
jgi:hypothetical protein